MTHNLLELLVNMEKSLHKSRTISSEDTINELLSGNFQEIGASGKTYNKNQIIELLKNEEPFDINATDFELRLLSSDIAQLKYKSSTSNNNNLSSTTLRSSIWKHEGKKWKMIFHQGTVVQK